MYYITICTNNREKILAEITAKQTVGNDALVVPFNKNLEPIIYLTDIGKEVQNSILNIQLKNTGIYIDKYVIMPDHIHMIININNKCHAEENFKKIYGFENTDIGKERRGRRSLQGLIKDFKSVTTRKFGKKLWQKSYYEHVIRNEKEYYEICNYIQENPFRYILKNIDIDFS